MKGDIYEYDGKEFILEGKYFEEYVKLTRVDIEKEYSVQDAENILNSNVIAVYKGIFHCKKPLMGEVICNILSDIKEEIEIRIDITCEEI